VRSSVIGPLGPPTRIGLVRVHDDPADAARADPGFGQAAGGGGVAASHVGIVAVVQAEVGALRAFQQNAPAGAVAVIEDLAGGRGRVRAQVGDVAGQADAVGV